MRDTVEVLVLLALFAVAFFGAWVTSASEIARECEKLGAFYVGNTVYKCEVKK